MSSFFYSTKTAEKEHYPIPEALEPQHILGVFHDHSTLSQVFWPGEVLEETRTDRSPDSKPISTAYTIGQPNATTKATLTSQGDGVGVGPGVVCTEDMPLGLQFTVTYRIVGPPGNAAEHRLYLEEERSVVALKPLSRIVNMKEGPIVKTRNLVRVLGDLGRNGVDMASALESLNASTIEARELGKHKGD